MYFWLPNSPKKPLSFLLNLGRWNTYTQWFLTVLPKQGPAGSKHFPTTVCIWKRNVLWRTVWRLWQAKRIFNLYVITPNVFILSHVSSPRFFWPQQSVHIKTRHPLSPQHFTCRQACRYATLLQPSSRDDESEEPTPFLCTAVAIIRLWCVSTKKSMEHALNSPALKKLMLTNTTVSHV
jgi:hypothetical protein